MVIITMTSIGDFCQGNGPCGGICGENMDGGTLSMGTGTV